MDMAVLKIKQETRDLSPQMALLHLRWQQIRQIELNQELQSSQTERFAHLYMNPKKEYSAA